MRKPRTKKAMVAFLCDHFRYHTMNSWNRATSYAACIKLHQIIPNEINPEAYNFLQTEEAFRDGNEIIREFERRWNYEWQIGSNGRSNGYLVLLKGGIREPKNSFKRYCSNCGQGNYKEGANVCGRCHQEGLIDYPFVQTFTSGASVDEDLEDFESWDVDSLRDRVDVVWDFDKTVEKVKEAFIDFVRGHKVIEKEIMVPKTVHVAVPKKGGKK
jgi:hypothetical protein